MEGGGVEAAADTNNSPGPGGIPDGAKVNPSVCRFTGRSREDLFSTPNRSLKKEFVCV